MAKYGCGYFLKDEIVNSATSKWAMFADRSEIEEWAKAFDAPYTVEEHAIADAEHHKDEATLKNLIAKYPQAAYNRNVRQWVRDLLLSGDFRYVNEAANGGAVIDSDTEGFDE